MEIIEVTTDLESIDLYGLGDIHLGDINCELDKFKQVLKDIEGNPRARVIIMGDLLNCATKSSVGKAVFDEYMKAEDQWALALKLLEPIKGKIVGMLIGNHEFRLEKEGFNPIKTLCLALKVPYLGYSTMLNVKVAGTTTTVYATHGHGGASKNSVIGKLNKLSEIAVANVYMRGHSHQLIYHRTMIRIVKDGKLVDEERLVVDTGSFLKYDEGYAEMSNLAMVRSGCAVIHFSSNGYTVNI